MKTLVTAAFCVLLICGCNSSRQTFFNRKTPHEQYQSALRDAGLAGTLLYTAWVEAASSGLKSPTIVVLPYKETGYFPADIPRAAGYAFSAKKGEMLSYAIEKLPVEGRIFCELWKMEDSTRKLLYAADSLERTWQFEIENDGKYLLRIQPELLYATGYTITIAAGPSLEFPVRMNDKPDISSFWGDSRDAGGRKHEGIDIFARKRTPAIAAATGTVTRVGNNKLGGKVVFLRPIGKNYQLYYAHLDTQLVREDQTIKAGQVLGLIGNTGNARTTAPHLHFGIYSSSGAVDPLPFINNNRPAVSSVQVDGSRFNTVLRTTVKTSLSLNLAPSSASIVLEKGTIVSAIAGTGQWYKVTLPDGTIGFIKSGLVTGQPLPGKVTITVTGLFDSPGNTSVLRSRITTSTEVTVYGLWKEYAYIQIGNEKGWVKRNELL